MTKDDTFDYPNFSMLIRNSNLKKIQEDLEEDGIVIIDEKQLGYDDEYRIITFGIQTEEPEDYDLEVLLNTMGGIAIHEVDSNCVALLESDVDEVSNIFCWGGSGDILVGELFTPEECVYLLEKFCKTINPQQKKIYVSDKDGNEAVLEEGGSILFKGDSPKYKIGEHGAYEMVWWPSIIEKLGSNFFYLIQNDTEDDDNDIYSPNPWDPKDNDYFNDYDDYYYKERFDT